MGRNKGRQSRQLWDGAGGGGGGGGGKGSSLESYVRGQQLLLRGGSSGGSARASVTASRPVLDVARFQRILTSETRDQHDRHIQLATPFLELSQSHAEALRTRRRLEESRESDEGLYRELDRTVSPVRPLQDLCLRVLARHAASLSQDARREIEALPHATLSRFSLHASRSGTLSQSLLDWLCCAVRPGPTELCIGVGVGAGAAAGATAQQQLCPRRALLAKPEAAAAAAAAPRSAGAYVDNWEELDLDQPGVLPRGRALLLQQQPLAGSLLRLHLVGLVLPGHHALGAVLARSCVSLQHLTLHRAHIAGGGLERWFTDLLLPPRQWAADSPSSSTSSSSSSSSSTSTSSAFAPSQMADEGGPAWPALSTLHVSFCLDADSATRALEHLSLELFVQRRAQAGTPVLAALKTIRNSPAPDGSQDCLEALALQLGRSGICLAV